MPPKTRLDALVKIRDEEEQRAQLALAKTITNTKAAVDAVENARKAAAADGRGAGSAAMWEMEDGARVRLLAAVKAAEQVLEKARLVESQARKVLAEVHKKAEAVRRAAEHKREEIISEENRAETKQNDEQAGVRHWHNKQ